MGERGNTSFILVLFVLIPRYGVCLGSHITYQDTMGATYDCRKAGKNSVILSLSFTHCITRSRWCCSTNLLTLTSRADLRNPRIWLITWVSSGCSTCLRAPLDFRGICNLDCQRGSRNWSHLLLASRRILHRSVATTFTVSLVSSRASPSITCRCIYR